MSHLSGTVADLLSDSVATTVPDAPVPAMTVPGAAVSSPDAAPAAAVPGASVSSTEDAPAATVSCVTVSSTSSTGYTATNYPPLEDFTSGWREVSSEPDYLRREVEQSPDTVNH